MKSLLLLLAIFSASASAECYIVTDLATSWQKRLSRIFIHTGERRNIEYQLVIEADSVEISPSEFNCILWSHSPKNGISSFTCGIDVGVLSENGEKINPDVLRDGSNSETHIKFYKSTGISKERWTIFWDSNLVLVNEFGSKPKAFSGNVKASC